MNRQQQQVRQFHEAFGLFVEHRPTLIPEAQTANRFRLMAEELTEYGQACDKGSLPDIADALADLAYVVLGSAVEHGIDLEAVFDIVHDANMRKVGGYKDESGKWRKPEGWQPPDIKAEIERQLRDTGGWVDAQVEGFGVGI